MSDYATAGNSMADEDLCIAVGEDLVKHYPGHPWVVGVDLAAGSIVIDLGYEKPAALRQFAYLLHPSTLMAPNGHHRVMQAGGELLERFRLARVAGDGDSRAAVQENGLIVDDTAEGAHALKKAGL